MIAIRRAGHRLLIFIGIVCATSWLPSRSAVAQSASCDPTTPQALNLRTFQKAASAYVSQLPRPQAASALLVCLKHGNSELAETLMLYKFRLRARVRNVEAVRAAFLHYVINTGEPKLSGDSLPDLERLAQTYRQSLPPPPDGREADAARECGDLPPTLRMLRCVGRVANRQRYGRDDVIPVSLLEFGVPAAGYSLFNATRMAEMSDLSYWDSARISEQLRRSGYTRTTEITDPATDTSAFVATKDKVVVLAFRGTSGFKNFITDLDGRRAAADWAKGTMHNGFKSALDAVWLQIKSALTPYKDRPIWLTGHSLGAALAQLAALRLQAEGYSVHSVYTFGTPRTGDSDFVADYNRRLGAQSFPHVNARDLVTRVPPLSLGFHTAGNTNMMRFTGPKHDMERQSLEPADSPTAPGDWQRGAVRSISETTEFLPTALRPQALRSVAFATPPESNFYSARFNSGPFADHSSGEYLFKLVCATIEYELWPMERRQSNHRGGTP